MISVRFTYVCTPSAKPQLLVPGRAALRAPPFTLAARVDRRRGGIGRGAVQRVAQRPALRPAQPRQAIEKGAELVGAHRGLLRSAAAVLHQNRCGTVKPTVDAYRAKGDVFELLTKR